MPEASEIAEAVELIAELASGGDLDREFTQEEWVVIEFATEAYDFTYKLERVVLSPTPSNFVALVLGVLDSEAFDKLLNALRTVSVSIKAGTVEISEGVDAEIDFTR